ncbi:MAG: cell division protein FtsZ [Candidatus Bipolaricaulis sp.]|nr:cell division protein FtsZ [Candidatus Bipolaricaulis sp.]MDD5219284.1 cell division protein FtsZ [Candidatus Bipolaricaulis sp.]MDD5646262.1 cell division protein FtsZ [Candidatus Bipolaricaulis sp.]
MADAKQDGSKEGSLREVWKAVRDAIDDRILRACLPLDAKAVVQSEGRLYILVDTEFKKEYCLRKLDKLHEAVERVLGPHEIVIGEPPLIEQARESEPQGRGANARILVIGVGDGGVNAVARMREERLSGVRFVAVDTDRQVLQAAPVKEQLQLGADITGGRGTGGDPERARRAAEESRWEVANLLRGTDLVFITAGLGGGTGSGAAPIIAQVAREQGALTVGVVTKPFTFEGTTRQANAERGLAELRAAADVLIVISNDRLLETSARGMPMTKAFELADGILHQGVRGISDLITVRGLINLDFADIRSLLAHAGDAMMGTGEASGVGRALTAAKAASTNPLLEGDSIRGARKMILNVTGGPDLTLGEVMQAAEHIRQAAATECDLVFGAVIREDVSHSVRITVIAAAFRKEESIAREQKRHVKRERVSGKVNLDVPTFLRRERDAEEEE